MSQATSIRPHPIATVNPHTDEGDIGLRVEAEPGSRGTVLSVDRELGVAPATSDWVSGDAMGEAEKPEATRRDDLVRSGTATVSIVSSSSSLG